MHDHKAETLLSLLGDSLADEKTAEDSTVLQEEVRKLRRCIKILARELPRSSSLYRSVDLYLAAQAESLRGRIVACIGTLGDEDIVPVLIASLQSIDTIRRCLSHVLSEGRDGNS